MFLERPFGTHLHTGIVYRDASGKAKQLDLAWHKKLRVLDCQASIGCAVPGFDPTDEQFIALYCGKIARSYPVRKLPYNLKVDNEVRFNAGGGVEVGEQYTGMSCATFVVAVFRSAGHPLIDTDGWPVATEEDREIQAKFVAYMRERNNPEEIKQADIIEAEIGCPRVAPEEVAGACLEDQRPAGHDLCAKAGAFIISSIDGPHIQPPAPHSSAA